MQKFAVAFMAHPFTIALAITALLLIVAMIVDFSRGMTRRGLRDLIVGRKVDAILSLAVVYAVVFLFVNALSLALHFIVPNA